jgi:hypothetical protein
MASADSSSPSEDAARAALGRASGLLIALLVTLLTGCGPQLREPTTLAAPYERTQLWGVVPPMNESGTSVVDELALADAFMQEAQQIDGINMISVNRIIAAMRGLELDGIDSHADAFTLMSALRLDGLIVGVVTAYDPYRPLTLGMAVQLYVREYEEYRSTLDPRALESSTSGSEPAIGSMSPLGPVAEAAGVFRASNHQTLSQLADYASGRSRPDSAYGEDVYQVSMDLYARFVSHRLLRDLLLQERMRTGSLKEIVQVPR